MNTNYFELFGLEAEFRIDLADLKQRYHELQRSTHPDRHARAGGQEQMLSVQYSATVNDAFTVLKSPVKRALYLLNLAGLEFDIEHTTLHDPEFLMEQMERREALAELRSAEDPEAALDAMSQELKQQQQSLGEEFAQAMQAQDLEAAKELAIRMQFNEKMQIELNLLEEEMLDF